MTPLAEMKSSWRIVAVFHLIELPFAVLVAIALPSLIGLELGAVLGVLVVTGLARLVFNVAYQRSLLRPIDEWRRAPAEDDRPLLTARAALGDAPTRMALIHSAGWAVTLTAAIATIWLAMAATAPLGVAELGMVALFFVACTAGAAGFSFPMMTVMLARERAALSRALSRRGREQPVHPVSLARRLAVLLVLFVVAPGALMAAATRASDVTLERYAAVAELDALATREAERMASGLAPRRGRVVNAGELPPLVDNAAIDPLPPSDHRVTFDRRSERASVAVALDDSRWLLLEGSTKGMGSQSLRLLLFCLVFLIWAPILAVLVPRSLVAPLRDLELLVRRLVLVGDLRELEHVPVLEDDELGTLTRCFNELVDNLRELADAARAVSDGDLGAGLDREGDLHEAFRGMLEWLREMVGRIRETADSVGSAAAEIQAATQEQEDGARQHARAVGEVSEHIASLARSATDITAAAVEVLDNAEGALATSDDMATKIAELSRQLGGVGELLDIIREVADRSDLLALNGSLEATRAGEAGRGFALVAAEMRRLAERVTAAVSDVRNRIEAIQRAGGATVSATHESRTIAQSTAAAARQISKVTARQGGDTQQLSETMRSMEEFVVSASAATSQTRAASEGLSQRIEELDRLTRHFNLE